MCGRSCVLTHSLFQAVKFKLVVANLNLKEKYTLQNLYILNPFEQFALLQYLIMKSSINV